MKWYLNLCVDLTRLDLRTVPDGRSEIQDAISVIGNMTKLQYLNLAGHTNLGYFNLDMLSTMKDLKNLNLSGMHFVCDCDLVC